MLDAVFDRLREMSRPYRGVIEDALEGTFQTDTVLDRAIRHVLFADAKRLRASLALMAMEAAGGSARAALPIAVAFELAHTASLIHDDIMDGARMRRGRRCVHHVFGRHIAITAGDALIFEAYRRILSLAGHHPGPTVERILQIFTTCAARTCRGQAQDLTFSAECGTMRQYLAMIRAKTGSMIEAPLESAALLAGAPPFWRARLRRYGGYVGMAFQIVDDALEYVGSEVRAGKTLGKDLRHGGGSAMLIFCREVCNPVEREALAAAIRRIRASGDPGSVEVVLALLRKHGAVEFARRLCARYATRALRALEDVGVAPARAELGAVARIVGAWDGLPDPLPGRATAGLVSGAS